MTCSRIKTTIFEELYRSCVEISMEGAFIAEESKSPNDFARCWITTIFLYSSNPPRLLRTVEYIVHSLFRLPSLGSVHPLLWCPRSPFDYPFGYSFIDESGHLQHYYKIEKERERFMTE